MYETAQRIRPARATRSRVVLLFGLASLVGCVAPEPMLSRSASGPAESAPRLVLHEVAFEPGSASLAPGELESLSVFLRQAPVLVPHARLFAPGEESPGDRSSRRGLARERLRRISDLLERHGFVTTADIGPGAAAGGQPIPPSLRPPGRPLDPGIVKIAFYALTDRDCRLELAPTSEHAPRAPQHDIGCASDHNLGSMIAAPPPPFPETTRIRSDATREAEAVLRYRTDKVKPLAGEDATP